MSKKIFTGPIVSRPGITFTEKFPFDIYTVRLMLDFGGGFATVTVRLILVVVFGYNEKVETVLNEAEAFETFSGDDSKVDSVETSVVNSINEDAFETFSGIEITAVSKGVAGAGDVDSSQEAVPIVDSNVEFCIVSLVLCISR